MLESVRREIKFDGPVCLIEAKDLLARMCDESLSKGFIGSRVHFCDGQIVVVYEDRHTNRNTNTKVE